MQGSWGGAGLQGSRGGAGYAGDLGREVHLSHISGLLKRKLIRLSRSRHQYFNERKC